MSRLVWDEESKKLYTLGVDKGVLYVYDSAKKKYGDGAAWDGLTAVNESPSGADASDFYANNSLYASVRSTEKFGATIEAYYYPEEFEACNGRVEKAPGVYVTMQTRKMFAFSYRTLIGNDTDGQEHGYTIHLVYGATASPSSVDHATINDNVDIPTMSWEVTTVPVPVEGLKPTSHIEIDSTKVDAALLKKLEDKLYGTDTDMAGILLPAEVFDLLKASSTPAAG